MKRNDRKSPSQLKKPESIGWKKEIRKTPVDALEVMAKENKVWQKEQQKEIRHYKNLGLLDENNYLNEKAILGLPDPWQSALRTKILKTKMTKIEWQNYCIKQDMLAKNDREEYFKNNKMSKAIVNKILELDGVIYIACKGGHGRSGMIAACIIGRKQNLSSEDALNLINNEWMTQRDMSYLSPKIIKLGSPQTRVQKNIVRKFLS